jgi:hypothetical protein
MKWFLILLFFPMLAFADDVRPDYLFIQNASGTNVAVSVGVSSFFIAPGQWSVQVAQDVACSIAGTNFTTLIRPDGIQPVRYCNFVATNSSGDFVVQRWTEERLLLPDEDRFESWDAFTKGLGFALFAFASGLIFRIIGKVTNHSSEL